MGFYVPDTLSDSFVSSKRTQEGNYAYEEQKNKIGVMEQKALQDLNESYSSTINNAYDSYLASQRAVLGSSMGQGFKEQYLQQKQQDLMTDIANANLSLAKARSEIEGEAESARTQIESQRLGEIEYLERAIGSMENYMNYLDTATAVLKDEAGNDVTKTYLESATGLTPKEYKKFNVDEYYDLLLEAQPQDYSVGGDNANPAMSYYEWMRTQMKDTQADRDFEKWFYGSGGYEELKQALATVPKAEGNNSLTEYQERVSQVKSERKRIDDLLDVVKTRNYQSINPERYNQYVQKANEYRDKRDYEALSNLEKDLIKTMEEELDAAYRAKMRDVEILRNQLIDSEKYSKLADKYAKQLEEYRKNYDVDSIRKTHIVW